MKHKHAVLAVVISCFTLSLSSCSRVSNGVPPSPTTSKFLKGADGPPLYFVDNVEMGYFDDSKKGKLKISPNNIESVTVLSPASTSDLISRYGSRGKNGVVLVTTKKLSK